MSLKNFQYDTLMRSYNQKQFLHKHQQDERIREAEAKVPRLGEIRREIAGLGLQKARLLLGASKGKILTSQQKYRNSPQNAPAFLPQTDILPIIWICITTALSVTIQAI